MSIVLQALNQRPIAYFPLYRQLTGSIQGAVLLSQLMYWFSKKNKIYKTNKDFMDEIGLTEAEIKSAKKQVRRLPFITITREGIPAKSYYAINWNDYEKHISLSVGLNSPNCTGSKATNKMGEIHPTNTYTTTHTSHKEFTKVNSPTSGQGSNNVIDTTDIIVQQKREALSKVKNNIVKQSKTPLNIKEVHSKTIEVLDYWNTFDSLTTHNLVRRRNVAPLHKQSKTINNIDCAIQKLMRGTFYSGHSGIQAGLKKKKYTIADIKKAVKRMALACSPEYSKSTRRCSLMHFLHNPHMEMGKGKTKYRFVYPFLHFMNHTPVKISDSPVRSKSEYPILVDKVVKKLTGTVHLTDKQYNQVVKQIDKAMVFIKKVSNGNLAENRVRLPDLLQASLVENRLTLTVEDLPLGVYNLEKLMRKRLMVR